MSTKPPNRAERALALLESRYPGWVPAIEFERPCGRQAWRTAISEAREIAKRDGGDIDNRQQCKETLRGRWVLSEYRLKKASESASVEAIPSEAFNANAAPDGRLL